MNRRHILLGLAGTGAAASGYAWLERRGLTRADLGADLGDDTSTPGAPRLPPGIHAILGFALLAPSGHNAQPWTVRVGDGALRIGTDRAKWLPKVDPLNRELALSTGAFLENLLIAAPNYGYLADFSVSGGVSSGGELLQVTLKDTPLRPARQSSCAPYAPRRATGASSLGR